MTPDELLKVAKDKRLEVTSQGVNLDALLGDSGRTPAFFDEQMSEATFQQELIGLFHLHGWTVAWIRPVRVQRANGSVYYETPMGADGSGWPDLFATRGNRAIAAELKAGKNKATAAQLGWLDRLGQIPGIQTFEWRASDWTTIEEVLR